MGLFDDPYEQAYTSLAEVHPYTFKQKAVQTPGGTVFVPQTLKGEEFTTYGGVSAHAQEVLRKAGAKVTEVELPSMGILQAVEYGLGQGAQAAAGLLGARLGGQGLSMTASPPIQSSIVSGQPPRRGVRRGRRRARRGAPTWQARVQRFLHNAGY